MNNSESLKGRFSSMPSVFVIPVARNLYLLAAILSLLVVVGGLLYLGFLKVSTSVEPSTTPVPPPFQGSLSVPDPPLGDIDLGLVTARLKAPSNIRFSVTTGILTAPLKEGDSIGTFLADTPNEIATGLEGMSILGGQDAEFFERSFNREKGLVGLAARTLLVSVVSNELRDIKEPKSRTFSLRVMMRDRFGIASPPTDVAFSLQFAPPRKADLQPKADQPAATEKTEPQKTPTELEKLAGEIAKTVQPTVNPDYFRTYKEAIEIPKRCGVWDADTGAKFVASYRRGFESVRAQLTPSNLEAFYMGVCGAWKDVVQKQTQARQQEEQRQRAAKAQADEARERAIAHNRDLERQHSERVFEARSMMSPTLWVVGGALGVFLCISLVLAFLAMEQHSRAVRLAMDAMVKIVQDSKTAGQPVENESSIKS